MSDYQPIEAQDIQVTISPSPTKIEYTRKDEDDMNHLPSFIKIVGVPPPNTGN